MTELNTNKARMKTDYMIVATAVSNRLDCIYSDDRHELKTFAGKYIEVLELPSIAA